MTTSEAISFRRHDKSNWAAVIVNQSILYVIDQTISSLSSFLRRIRMSFKRVTQRQDPVFRISYSMCNFSFPMATTLPEGGVGNETALNRPMGRTQKYEGFLIPVLLLYHSTFMISYVQYI